jgi:hypothetical protein
MALQVLGKINDLIAADRLFDALAAIEKHGVDMFIGSPFVGAYDNQQEYKIVGYTHTVIKYKNLLSQSYPDIIHDISIDFFITSDYVLLRSSTIIVGMFDATT